MLPIKLIRVDETPVYVLPSAVAMLAPANDTDVSTTITYKYGGTAVVRGPAHVVATVLFGRGAGDRTVN